MIRLSFIVMLMLSLGSCTSMSAVSAVSSSAMNGVLYMFQGAEISLQLDLKKALVSVQKGLRRLDLDVDILEENDEKYFIQFSNKKLQGRMQLERETAKLTTVFVRVKKGVVRNESVEKAVLQVVERSSKHVSSRDKFSYRGYLYVYEKADNRSKTIAWFRRGAMASYTPVMSNDEWVKLKLPSNKKGFLKGRTANIQQK